MNLEEKLRKIPDFPEAGITFIIYILLFYAGSVAVGAWRLNKGIRE